MWWKQIQTCTSPSNSSSHWPASVLHNKAPQKITLSLQISLSHTYTSWRGVSWRKIQKEIRDSGHLYTSSSWNKQKKMIQFRGNNYNTLFWMIWFSIQNTPKNLQNFQHLMENYDKFPEHFLQKVTEFFYLNTLIENTVTETYHL